VKLRGTLSALEKRSVYVIVRSSGSPVSLRLLRCKSYLGTPYFSEVQVSERNFQLNVLGASILSSPFSKAFAGILNKVYSVYAETRQLTFTYVTVGNIYSRSFSMMKAKGYGDTNGRTSNSM